MRTGRPRIPRIEKQCRKCGKAFLAQKYECDIGGGIFCSMECHFVFNKGENHPRWKGGRHPSTMGYILVFAPDHPSVARSGYVFEHRLVAEKALGRFLTATEMIHHINEIRDDNRLENLYLCKDAAEHRRVHALQRKGVKVVSNLI